MRKKRPVEADIQPENTAEIILINRLTMPGLNVFKLRNRRISKGEFDEGGGVGFDQFADDVNALNLLCGIAPHNRPAMGDPLNKAEMLKLNQRLAYDMPLGGELLAELIFDQPLTRIELAEDDHFLKRLGHCGQQSLAAFLCGKSG